MAYVITLAGYRPVERLDGQAWTLAHIEEASSASGPWTEIELVTLSPVDSDPSDPAVRSFTTDAATLAAGWYRVIFEDSEGDTNPTSPVEHRSVPLPNFAPGVGDVGTLLRARTRDIDGVEQGTFTGETIPTYGQVDTLIVLAANSIASEVGKSVFDANLAEAARFLTSVRAAMLVELTHFPEQISGDDSAYGALRELYEAELPRLVKAVAEAGADGEAVAGEGGALPSYAFPEDDGGMVGWATVLD